MIIYQYRNICLKRRYAEWLQKNFQFIWRLTRRGIGIYIFVFLVFAGPTKD